MKKLKILLQKTLDFAKTYAKTLPHEYMVRKNVKSHFNEFVSAIRNKGFKAYFLDNEYIYLKFEDYFSWIAFFIRSFLFFTNFN